jgi:glucose/arabinose dehydrogenase
VLVGTIAVVGFSLVAAVYGYRRYGGHLPPLLAGPPLPAPPAEMAGGARLVRWAAAKEPVGLVFAPGDPERRLYVVEKPGQVRLFSPDGKAAEAPLVDVSARMKIAHREQGLLGLAFHPRVADNGRFYLNFTDLSGDTQVVEKRLAAAPGGGFRWDAVDPAHDRRILFVDQPYPNHNGGNLVFGPDGKLWVGLGDGGAAGDPERRAQDDKTLLGKMLRIDVDADPGRPDPTPEVVGKGVRNPWRYSFDRATGNLYVADVGQIRHEWIHVLPSGRLTGWNFGWNVVEGSECFKPRHCDRIRFPKPMVEYNHAEGCSITGGHVYRGKALPALAGHYFYADFCTALLRSFRIEGGKVVDHVTWKETLDPESQLAQVSDIAVDEAGELYVVSLEGPIWKLVPRAAGGE